MGLMFEMQMAYNGRELKDIKSGTFQQSAVISFSFKNDARDWNIFTLFKCLLARGIKQQKNTILVYNQYLYKVNSHI